MPTEALAFPTSAGHTLEGALELPTRLVRGTAFFRALLHLDRMLEGHLHIHTSVAD